MITNDSSAQIVKDTESLVREKFMGEGTGHDWWHIDRVRKLAIAIAKNEGADPFVTELGALLHDIADHKFHGGSLDIGPATAKSWLEKLNCDPAVVQKVVEIVAQVSFKGAAVKTPMSTLEGECVQDADRMDAIGAIGIARCFAFGGSRDQPIYNPEEETKLHDSFEAYHNSKSSSIGHFYEKLLLLKDRMNTATGKKIAVQRHELMERFLDHFHLEWEGEVKGDSPD